MFPVLPCSTLQNIENSCQKCKMKVLTLHTKNISGNAYDKAIVTNGKDPR